MEGESVDNASVTVHIASGNIQVFVDTAGRAS